MVSKQYRPSLVGGEISATAFGRIDQDISLKGVARARNVYVNSQGFMFRREGLAYIDNTPGDIAVRLVPFTFNSDQAYLLEFSPGQFRVFRNDVLQVTVVTAPVDALTADQVQEFTTTQSADTLILLHPDFEPIRITRTSDTVWLTDNVPLVNIPVFPFSGVTVTNPAATLTPSSTAGNNVTFTAGASVFAPADVGQFLAFDRGGLVFITSFVSGTQVTGDVFQDLFDLTAVPSGQWAIESGFEPVWSGSRGWPVSGLFFQSRLWFGGSRSRPQTIWGSRQGANFFDFKTGAGLATDAIDVDIGSNQLNAITHLSAARNLLIFTKGEEFYIPGEPGRPITPETITIAIATAHGSALQTSVSVDGAVLFLQAGGGIFREFIFNELDQTYNARNLSVLSPEILRNPVRMFARRASASLPVDYVYIINGDGTVAVLNTLREQKLLAWTLLDTAGSFEDGVPLGSAGYFVVQRTIDGVPRRHIEKLDADHFMDASIRQVEGSPKTAWTGFDHLDNETVKVRGDGFILQDALVTAGALTSSKAVSILEAGINYSALIETLPVDAELGGGARLTGDFRRVVWVNINLSQSRNIVVQSGASTFRPVFRQFGSQILDAPVALFDGWKKVFTSGVSRDPTIIITQEEPLEFIVLSLALGVG